MADAKELVFGISAKDDASPVFDALQKSLGTLADGLGGMMDPLRVLQGEMLKVGSDIAASTRTVDQIVEGFRELGQEFKKSGQEAEKARKSLAKIPPPESQKRVSQLSSWFDDLRGRVAALVAPLATVQGALAGFGVALGAGGLVATISSYEQLEARLKTVTGSASAANAAFAGLKDFAAKTPFQLDEVVTAFSKLRARGLDPSREALTAYGNIAAGMGLSLDQMIEAVGDAATGEFERLKEFGINASSQGDRVAFTFQGITTTVGKNAAEITKYLRGIGETKFAGAMDNQAKTLAGVWSNIVDNVKNFASEIGKAGLLDALAGVGQQLATVTGSGESLAKVIGANLGAAVTAVAGGVAFLARHFDLLLAGAAAFAGVNLASVFLAIVPAAGAALVSVEALTVALVSNPFTALAGAIGLAIGALVYYRNESVTVAGQQTTVWGAAVASAQVAWAVLSEGMAALSALADRVFRSEIVAAIVGGVATWATNLQTGVVTIINSVHNSGAAIIDVVRWTCQTAGKIFYDLTEGMAQALMALLSGDPAGAAAAAKAAIESGLGKGLQEGFAQIKAKVAADLSTDWVGGLMTGVTDTVTSATGGLVDRVGKQIADNSAKAREEAKQTGGAVKGYFGDAAAGVAASGTAAAATQKDAMAEVAAKAADTGKDIADKLRSGYDSALDASAKSADGQIANLAEVAKAAATARAGLAQGEAVAGGGKAVATRWDSKGRVTEIRKPDGVLSSFSSVIESFGFPAAATGGLITGPGTGTSDSILARLSNGEFVMRAAAVQRYGTGFLAALNGLRVPAFSVGGLVSGLSERLAGISLPGAPRLSVPSLPESAPAAEAGGAAGTVINIDRVVANDPAEFVSALNRMVRSGTAIRLDPAILGAAGKG